MPKYGDSAKQIPLIGIDLEKLTINDDHLLLWAIGGRSGHRPLWNQYYSTMSAFVYVLDSSNHQVIDYTKQQLHQLANSEIFQGKTLLIFANKQDLPGAMNADQLCDKLALEKLGENVQWHLQLANVFQDHFMFEAL